MRIISDDERKTMDLKERIREAINITSAENGSNTPDFILAEYLTDCLAAFDKATKARQTWHTPDKNHCIPSTHEKTKENTTTSLGTFIGVERR